jgi:hypothetical protein
MSDKTAFAPAFSLLIAVQFPGLAAAHDLVYVDKAIVWKHAAAGDSERVTIIVFNDDHGMFSLSTTLKRTPDTPAVRMNLKAGYLLFCGKWTKNSKGEVTAADHLLEAYKYRPNENDLNNHERTYTLELRGDAWGPLTDTLADGERIYGAMAGFQPTARELQSFWFVCAKS